MGGRESDTRRFIVVQRNVGWLWGVIVIGVMVAVHSPGWAADWSQWLGDKRDGVWRETDILQKFPPGGPKVVWRQPIHEGYSGPSVAEGKVYVMDRQRARDEAGQPVKPTRKGIPGTERVLCLDAKDGRLLWNDEYDCPYKVSYPSGPRTTPLVLQGRVYTLGAMGDLRVLDAATGKPIWTKNVSQEFKVDAPVWGYAAHPLIDGDLLYCLVGGEGSAVVAFNKDTGKEVWRTLTSQEIGYSPPMIYEAGGKRQLIIWLSESINGLDPVTGKVYWTQAYPSNGSPQRPAVNIVTVRRHDDLLFISTYYHGPMMLKLAADKPAASVLWKGKSNDPEKPDGLHILMAAPLFQDGCIYGVGANGEMRCLDAQTGKMFWESYAATCGQKTDCANAFLIPQGSQTVICNDQGDLILAHLDPKGYKEIDRAHILEPDHKARGRQVVWSHPAFAQRCLFARNDKEIICVSMAAQ
jgi:outer membrane protein assembly factor BamB